MPTERWGESGQNVASNVYYKAVKNTEEAAKATAAATAFSIGMNAVMQNRITATQQAQLAEAGRAAAAAEATYDVQLQALGEQRAHNYAMWRQTGDGQAYEAWKDRAWLLITAIEARNATFTFPFREDVAAFQAAQDAAPKEPKPPMAWWRSLLGLLAWAGALAIAAGALLGALALLLWLISFGRQVSDITSTWILCGAGLVAFVIGTVAIASPERAEWDKRRKTADQDAAAARVERFGFDPKAESGRLPAPWTSEGGMTDRLRAAMSAAYMEHPAPHSLPPLRMPAVRKPSSEPHAGTRGLLESYVVEDSQAADNH